MRTTKPVRISGIAKRGEPVSVSMRRECRAILDTVTAQALRGAPVSYDRATVYAAALYLGVAP